MSTPLHERIKALHQELHGLPEVDAATQEQLLILLADMSRLLDNTDSNASPAEAMEALAARFEVEHPALSSALRNLVDSLSKAGI